MKHTLSNVTLLGIDCIDASRLAKALDISSLEIEFADVKLLTSLPTTDSRKIQIPHLGAIEAFSEFCIRDLNNYVETTFVLLVQADGFILNPSAWQDRFLDYDYVGSPWLVGNDDIEIHGFPKDLLGKRVVGNGGFCLRSKKFLELSQELASQGTFAKYHPEDNVLCVFYRTEMESRGIAFAPVALAMQFSAEGPEDIYGCQFGFHDLKRTDISRWFAEHPEWSCDRRE